jgi:TolB-like protein/DNA-binding SARP family transcriptional activator
VLRLLTLGSLAVHGPAGPLTGSAAQPRRLAVLVLIARGGARGTQRTRVVNLLWPDATDEQGRRAIAQALYALRRDLGHDDAILGTQVLHLNGEVAWCDLAEFEAALARGEQARAVEVYAGPFLEGFRLPGSPEFERWADDERTAIEHRFHEAVEGLAQSAEARREFDDAVRWWRRRSASDPLNARVAIATMRSLAAAGDRAAAVRHAGLFEALVAEELEMPADREVVALADSLRREVASAFTPAEGVLPPSRPRAVAVLPFSVLGVPSGESNPERDWSEGLAEEIIHSLLAVPSLHVIARTASFALGPSPTLSDLRALDVSHVVEGCVRRMHSGLRVTVRLMEAHEGRAVWWDRIDSSHADAHHVLEDIATRVAQQMT